MSVDLQALRAKAQEATPGPWHANTTSHIVTDDEPKEVARIVIFDKDVEFIAACDPQTVLALLDAVEALRFYAGKRHLHREWSGEWVIRDRGEVARAALDALTETSEVAS